MPLLFLSSCQDHLFSKNRHAYSKLCFDITDSSHSAIFSPLAWIERGIVELEPVAKLVGCLGLITLKNELGL